MPSLDPLEPYFDALHAMRRHANAFEVARTLVAQIDRDLFADAKKTARNAPEFKTQYKVLKRDSIARKDAIDKCQWEMQQTNMYAGIAAAYGVGL